MLLVLFICVLIYYIALPRNPVKLFFAFFFSHFKKYIFNLFVQSWRTRLLRVLSVLPAAVAVGVTVGVWWVADRC